MLSIVTDILDFSKIEAGKLELENRPFELRACIEASLDLVAADAAKAELDLTYEVGPDAPQVIIGDWTRLRDSLCPARPRRIGR